MKKFYIKVIHNSKKRGYNRTVEVYTQCKDGSFSCVGADDRIQTNGYNGDEAVACKILREKYGYRWQKDRKYYKLQRKDIKLIFLP